MTATKTATTEGIEAARRDWLEDCGGYFMGVDAATARRYASESLREGDRWFAYYWLAYAGEVSRIAA